jgi:hypothetical protein
MEALFFGICTHLDFSVIGQPHRVVLPAADNYIVRGPAGVPLEIPNHTAQLTILEADILESTTEFAGGGMELVDSPVIGELCWTLNQVIIDFDGLETPLTSELHCLPHIGLPGVELQPGITGGEELGSVAAYIDVRNGLLSIVRDKSTLEGRHVLLLAPQTKPWRLQVRTPNGRRHALRMKPDALITFSNMTVNPMAPCDQNDYLMNFRLTTSPYVSPADFRLPADCILDAAIIDMRAFPRMSWASGTLSDCSNTVYP